MKPLRVGHLLLELGFAIGYYLRDHLNVVLSKGYLQRIGTNLLKEAQQFKGYIMRKKYKIQVLLERSCESCSTQDGFAYHPTDLIEPLLGIYIR